MKKKLLVYGLIISLLLNVFLVSNMFIAKNKVDNMQADLTRVYISTLERQVAPNFDAMTSSLEMNKYEDAINHAQNVLNSTMVMINMSDIEKDNIPSNLRKFVLEVSKISNDTSNKVRYSEKVDIELLKNHNKSLAGIVNEVKRKGIFQISNQEELFNNLEHITKAHIGY